MSCRFIKGFINRKRPLCAENIEFVRLVQYNYLMKLRDHVPKNVLDKSWLQPPSILEEVRVAAVTAASVLCHLCAHFVQEKRGDLPACPVFGCDGRAFGRPRDPLQCP